MFSGNLTKGDTSMGLVADDLHGTGVGGTSLLPAQIVYPRSVYLEMCHFAGSTDKMS